MAEDDFEVKKLNIKNIHFILPSSISAYLLKQLEGRFFLGFTLVNATITIVIISFKIVLIGVDHPLQIRETTGPTSK